MEEGTQDKVNSLIARQVDRITNLNQTQNKVILNHDDRIKDIYKSIKFLASIQILTLLVVGLIHATHSGWFDNIGWLQ